MRFVLIISFCVRMACTCMIKNEIHYICKRFFVGFKMASPVKWAQCVSAGFADVGLNLRFQLLHKQTTSVKPADVLNKQFPSEHRRTWTIRAPARDALWYSASGKRPIRWEVATAPRVTPGGHNQFIISHIIIIMFKTLYNLTCLSASKIAF